MANLKYSIPNNYEVREYMGLKGIVRRGKNGDKWLWEPVYQHIVIGKPFGKIIVASLSQMNALKGEDFLRVTEYDGNQLLPARVYDILIGENCLYIKTFRKDSDEVGWFMINEDFKGAKFIGDFELANRDRNYPFHVPVGTSAIMIRMDGEDKKIDLHTGEISEVKSHLFSEQSKQPKEEVLSHYTLFLKSESQDIRLLNPADNRVIKNSNSLGELDSYEKILESMLGSFENVPRERAEKLLDFFSRIEYYGNALVIPILYEYVRARVSGDIDTILTGMIKELDEDWTPMGDGNGIKVYTSGSIVMALVKLAEGRITVAPYIINGNDGILEVSDVEAMVNCYKTTGVKTTKLNINNVTLDEEITDEKDIANWPSPYSVKKRKLLEADIKDFTYEKVNIYYVLGEVIGADKKGYGDCGIHIALCNKFTYRSKDKVRGKIGKWITTNTYSAQVV